MSYVYLIHAKETRLFKIGFAGSDVNKRMRSIQTSSPFALDIIDSREGTQKDEATLHFELRDFRRQGEWFEFNDPSHAMKHFHSIKFESEIQERKLRRRCGNRQEQLARRIGNDVFESMGLSPRTFQLRDKPPFPIFMEVAQQALKHDYEPNIRECARLLMSLQDGEYDGREPLIVPKPTKGS